MDWAIHGEIAESGGLRSVWRHQASLIEGQTCHKLGQLLGASYSSSRFARQLHRLLASSSLLLRIAHLESGRRAKGLPESCRLPTRIGTL
jgi:hypothetical protein